MTHKSVDKQTVLEGINHPTDRAPPSKQCEVNKANKHSYHQADWPLNTNPVHVNHWTSPR